MKWTYLVTLIVLNNGFHSTYRISLMAFLCIFPSICLFFGRHTTAIAAAIATVGPPAQPRPAPRHGRAQGGAEETQHADSAGAMGRGR